jgi:dihydroxyacid dehydratase/phosphogluconate dehydratase
MGLPAPAGYTVLLGCALRPPAVAALTDGRFSGAFTPEATVAAPHAITPELSV